MHEAVKQTIHRRSKTTRTSWASYGLLIRELRSWIEENLEPSIIPGNGDFKREVVYVRLCLRICLLQTVREQGFLFTYTTTDRDTESSGLRRCPNNSLIPSFMIFLRVSMEFLVMTLQGSRWMDPQHDQISSQRHEELKGSTDDLQGLHC
jgi:hypothetical protein